MMQVAEEESSVRLGVSHGVPSGVKLIAYDLPLLVQTKGDEEDRFHMPHALFTRATFAASNAGAMFA